LRKPDQRALTAFFHALRLSELNRHFSKIGKIFISSSPIDLLGGEPPPAKPGPPSLEVSKKELLFRANVALLPGLFVPAAMPRSLQGANPKIQGGGVFDVGVRGARLTRRRIDQAQALAHYAKQRDDHELTKWMSEIRLRATAQIGKISRELKGKVCSQTGRLSSHWWPDKGETTH
jgi:hypothetical protein